MAPAPEPTAALASTVNVAAIATAGSTADQLQFLDLASSNRDVLA